MVEFAYDPALFRRVLTARLSIFQLLTPRENASGLPRALQIVTRV
jgi:hypothetical protein